MPNLTAKEAAEALANGELDKVLEGTLYAQGQIPLETIRGLMAADRDKFINAAKVQVLQLALAETEKALQFYAAKENYDEKPNPVDRGYWDFPVVDDNGKKALAALETIAKVKGV